MGWDSICSSASKYTLYLSNCGQSNPNATTVSVWHPSTTPTPVPKSTGIGGTGGPCDCTTLYNDGGASGSIWDSAFANGQEYWQNTSSNQDMLSYNSASAVQTFVAGGTASLYNSCAGKIGQKNIAAKRQWSGHYGFSDVDLCATNSMVNPPTQTKYGTWTISATYTNNNEASGALSQINLVCGGSLSVGLYGIVSSTLSSTENDYYDGSAIGGPSYQTKMVDGHCNGWTQDASLTKSYFTQGDLPAVYLPGGNDVGCDGDLIDTPIGENLGEIISGWNAEWQPLPNDGINYSYTTYSAVTNPLSFNGTVTGKAYFSQSGMVVNTTETQTVAWNITSQTCSFTWLLSSNDHGQANINYPLINSITWSGAFNLSNPITAQAIYADCVTLLSNYNLADDIQVPWQTGNNTMYMPLVTRREVQQDVNPVMPGTVCTVPNYFDPITDYNGNAPFTSGNPTPPIGWTYNPSNNDCNGNPPSSPDYGGPCDWQQHYTQMPWFDPHGNYWVPDPAKLGAVLAFNSSHIDGQIIGKPLLFPPAQGFDWFNFYFTQYNTCTTPDGCSGPAYTIWPYFYGATTADAFVSVPGNEGGPEYAGFMPMESTHWVNNLQAFGYPWNGAIRASNPPNVNGGEIYVSKWAATRIPLPSVNFFRPCGNDRVLTYEPSSTCIISPPQAGDNDINIVNPLSSSNGPMTSADNVLIAFSPFNNGIYKGCSQTLNGDGTYTLTTGSLVSTLPTNYSHELSNYYTSLGNNGFVGIIRFPNAWPICGRIPISISTGYSGSLTGSNILFQAPQYNLRTNDSVNFYSNGMSLISSSILFRVNDSNFFSKLTTGSLANAYWAQSSGSPDYTWNDTSPKFTARWQEFFTSNRSASFNYSHSCNSSCVPYSACNPQVICFSPNGESFPNGITQWYDDDFIADGVWGCYEQLCGDNTYGEFGMIDPFYQVPKIPCNTAAAVNFTLLQDNGTCQTDTTNPDTGDITAYYAAPPMVEALCSPPIGNPYLSASIQPIVQAQLAGNIAIQSFAFPLTIYELYKNEVASCGGSCRFAYQFC